MLTWGNLDSGDLVVYTTPIITPIITRVYITLGWQKGNLMALRLDDAKLVHLIHQSAKLDALDDGWSAEVASPRRAKTA